MYELTERESPISEDPTSPTQRKIESYKLLKTPSEQQLTNELQSPISDDHLPEITTAAPGATPSKFIYLNVYFIVIASVLGTGILGLPVKLAHSGFTPFIVSYTLCFFMQVCKNIITNSC